MTRKLWFTIFPSQNNTHLFFLKNICIGMFFLDNFIFFYYG